MQTLTPSERQLEILHLVSQGKTRSAIGRTLYVSEDTVKTHLKRLTTVYGLPTGDSHTLVSEALRRGDLDFDFLRRKIVRGAYGD